MAVTFKLDVTLEQRLRDSAARSGRSASEVIRAALVAYLDASDGAEPPSAYELGADLFGKYEGSADLAERRKSQLADAWSEKHRRRHGAA